MPSPLISLVIVTLVIAFVLLLFWPKRGLFRRWQHVRQLTEQVLCEDALKHIYKCESKGRWPTVQSIAGALHITVDDAARLLAKMEAHDFLRCEGGEICLTPSGQDYALHIIRTHRLWECYLSDKTGFTETEWHKQAERLEHSLSPAEVNTLSAQLGNPTHDPHGDPIPTAGGEMRPHGGQSLTTMAINRPCRIIHLEDEPESVYAQLVAEGLYPGMEVRLVETTPQGVRFWANGSEHILAPIVASNISVVPLPKSHQNRATGVPLSHLELGESGKVIGISRAYHGAERRRLMDLGLVPGTEIKVELRSPNGDPTAYRIRGTLIALRREQAELINITRQKETA